MQTYFEKYIMSQVLTKKYTHKSIKQGGNKEFKEIKTEQLQEKRKKRKKGKLKSIGRNKKEYQRKEKKKEQEKQEQLKKQKQNKKKQLKKEKLEKQKWIKNFGKMLRIKIKTELYIFLPEISMILFMIFDSK